MRVCYSVPIHFELRARDKSYATGGAARGSRPRHIPCTAHTGQDIGYTRKHMVGISYNLHKHNNHSHNNNNVINGNNNLCLCDVYCIIYENTSLRRECEREPLKKK